MPPVFCRAVCALLAATTLAAQGTAGDSVPKSAEKVPISDNSFLLEEAYNQEPGVVQHISGFSRTSGANGWGYSFTQEWPFKGQRNQLSYTLPIVQAANTGSSGIGDLMLNYRVQAVYDEDRGIAFSPRLSVSLPTGNENKGLGSGVTGWQVNIPVSKTLGASFVSHTNAGLTWYPTAPSSGDGSSLRIVNLGQSLIWLVTPRFNVMLESVWTRATLSRSAITDEETAFISPGIRWGHDFKSGLQVVPGIAFPIGVGPSNGAKQVFLYLSLEHPFTAAARAAAR